jgi:hypothetical protein
MKTLHVPKSTLAARAVLMAALCAFASCAGASGEEGGAESASRDSKRGPTVPDSLSGASLVKSPAVPILGDFGPVAGSGRTLVVYFTSGDAAGRVAEDLAALFSADVERLRETKRRGPGFLGFMGAGMDATFGASTRIEPVAFDPAGYDRVFVVSPVWAWNLCPPVRTWLRAHSGRLPPAAFVTVSGDTEPDKIAAAMAKAGGREPFAVVGFSERDFYPENRAAYLGKMRALCEGAGVR